MPLELFRLMAEQVRDYALFLLDPEGRVMSWGAGARRLHGYRAPEILGRHFSIFHPQEAIVRGWPEEMLARAGREGQFEDEGWRLRKDGSRFWGNVLITALRGADGRLVAFSEISRDFSERHQKEQALRDSEERFRLLVEGVVDYAIYMLDPAGFVTSWNSGAERIKGYRRDEILERHFSNFFTDEDVAAGKPWAELAAAARDGRVEAEAWRVRKGGERFWARVVVTALHDARGELRGFAKVTQDMTAQRQVQELEAAARKVNEFIAMLAHEIRNPLAPIQSAVAVMRQAPPGSPLQEQMSAIIERQAARLARIAEDMVDITRVTRGELKMQRGPVRPEDVIARAVEAATPHIRAGAHELALDVPADLPMLEGDRDRLVQVFSNLLNNAARYTPDGGRIAVTARCEDGQVVIRTRDNGRGIEPEDLMRIFQMFVQGHAPLERVGAGLGVGLALARSIVELHGGSVEALSEGRDRGSEFVVRLPAAVPAMQPQAAQPAAPAAQASRRILLVDDNQDAAVSLQLLLEALGHETRAAFDGQSALAAFEEFAPDVVLLDIGMPGMNGYEVARQMRSRRADLRIVAVTGWGQADDRSRSAEAGIDLHLVKPIDQSQLAQAIGTSVH